MNTSRALLANALLTSIAAVAADALEWFRREWGGGDWDSIIAAARLSIAKIPLRIGAPAASASSTPLPAPVHARQTIS